MHFLLSFRAGGSCAFLLRGTPCPSARPGVAKCKGARGGGGSPTPQGRPPGRPAQAEGAEGWGYPLWRRSEPLYGARGWPLRRVQGGRRSRRPGTVVPAVRRLQAVVRTSRHGLKADAAGLGCSREGSSPDGRDGTARCAQAHRARSLGAQRGGTRPAVTGLTSMKALENVLTH